MTHGGSRCRNKHGHHHELSIKVAEQRCRSTRRQASGDVVSEREARTTEATDACHAVMPMQDWMTYVENTITQRFETLAREIEMLKVRMTKTTSKIEAGEGILVELRTVIKVPQEC